ncbi:hypothetical protein C823_006610 [Eubacterium plexicaudatum ASF492]|nr:hypothetical protein C823_006610 [Eubacterium plexicaudatum ASF492]
MRPSFGTNLPLSEEYICQKAFFKHALAKEWKEECSNIELWAKFINAEEREEFAMIAEKDPYIKSAYEQLQIISQDKEKRLEYEAREKAIRDHYQFMFEAEQRGIEIGEQRGIEIGEQRGIEIGEKRGIEIGEERGEKRGMEQGIFGAISICRDMGLPDIEISKRYGKNTDYPRKQQEIIYENLSRNQFNRIGWQRGFR